MLIHPIVCDTQQEKMRSPLLRVESAAFSSTWCYRVSPLLQSATGCYRVLQCARECYRVLESASSASGCYTVPVNPQCLLFYRVLHGDTGWYSVQELTSWQALSSDTGPAPEKEWTCQGRWENTRKNNTNDKQVPASEKVKLEAGAQRVTLENIYSRCSYSTWQSQGWPPWERNARSWQDEDVTLVQTLCARDNFVLYVIFHACQNTQAAYLEVGRGHRV